MQSIQASPPDSGVLPQPCVRSPNAALCALPYAPRDLSRSERRREDLYLFRSPKLGRRTELVGCLTLALALTFEFDATCEAYTERPRKLVVGDSTVELSFWTRHSRGLERFWLIVPVDETREPQSPRRAHRDAAALIDAAQAAQIRLEFVFEEDIKKKADAIHTFFRLLPYVQTVRDLPSAEALRQHVRTVFTTLERATFPQIESELRAFHVADVRAAVCDLIHRGELKLLDPTRLERFSVVIRTGGTHAPA